METRARSAAKAALWTLIGLVMMAGVGMAMTGSAATGGLMAVINACLGFLGYLVYERVWARVRWGRVDG